jgi:hypothetical protein
VAFGDAAHGLQRALAAVPGGEAVGHCSLRHDAPTAALISTHKALAVAVGFGLCVLLLLGEMLAVDV